MNNDPSLNEGMQNQVFWITRRIALGRYATETRAEYLLRSGVTHVFNVSESPSILRPEPKQGFVEVVDYPMTDFNRLADETAISTIDILQRMLLQAESKVYIHCIAGQVRSPTILWLYFIACGLSPDQSRKLISEKTLDAVPGHHNLVDEQLVQLVQQHGRENFLPLADDDIVTPAY